MASRELKTIQKEKGQRGTQIGLVLGAEKGLNEKP